MSPEGLDFLQTKFKLHFRSDDQDEHLKSTENREITILELIQEIVEAHLRPEGIDFVEWNAGRKIDAQMKEQGFQIKIKQDPQTGFCMGGNLSNCGTWMDKMGSAPSNKGTPATPRDGAPIELVAL